MMCEYCDVEEAVRYGLCEKHAREADNGPSDEQQESAAESFDYARESYERDMVDAGRGHLIGRTK